MTERINKVKSLLSEEKLMVKLIKKKTQNIQIDNSGIII